MLMFLVHEVQSPIYPLWLHSMHWKSHYSKEDHFSGHVVLDIYVNDMFLTNKMRQVYLVDFISTQSWETYKHCGISYG